VATLAGSDRDSIPSTYLAAADVFRVGHSFEMSRVDAGSIPAEMVHDVIWRNLAAVEKVGDAMGSSAVLAPACFDKDHAVPVSI